MARPTPLSGFPELLPEQRLVEQQVLDVLRTTFELHGFVGIETRAVEPIDQLLRKFLDAVEERMLEETRIGTFPDYKLVEGRRGKRDWRSPEDAEALMKSMRLKKDEMYDEKLISPTKAEKLLKDKLATEDEERRAQDDVQRLTDRTIAEIDRLVTAKEAEVMAV